MSYNILEARVVYNDKDLKQIKCVTVLVEISKGDIRPITANDQPKSGYMFITPNAVLSDRLLQMVAATGMQIPFSEADKMFPSWRVKYI